MIKEDLLAHMVYKVMVLAESNAPRTSVSKLRTCESCKYKLLNIAAIVLLDAVSNGRQLRYW